MNFFFCSKLVEIFGAEFTYAQMFGDTFQIQLLNGLTFDVGFCQICLGEKFQLNLKRIQRMFVWDESYEKDKITFRGKLW